MDLSSIHFGKTRGISVPSERFVAAASLTLQKNICSCRFAYATEKHLKLPQDFLSTI